MNRPPELPAGVIPAGATHFYHDPSRSKPGTQAWRKQEGGKWCMFADGEWRIIKGSNAHMFVAIEQVLRPAWDGEGLPPVGTVCEHKDYGGVTILAHGIFRGQPVVIAQGHDTVVTATADYYFPIRTAEQIAAEERKAGIAEMFASLMDADIGRFDNRSDICEALYDAGYRKQVQS